MPAWKKYGLWPFILLLGATLLQAAPEAEAPAEDARRVRLLGETTPSARFAGFYVAEAKGYYQREGLQVEFIRRRTGTVQEWDYLADGQCDFLWADLLPMMQAAVEQQANVLNVAQISQHSSRVLATRAARGIRSPAELTALWVTVRPHDALLAGALFARFDATPRLLVQDRRLELFLAGAVEACLLRGGTDLWQLLHTGMEESELTLFPLNALAIDIPEEGIYCRPDFAETQADICRAFIRASLAGWKDAFEHPADAITIIQKQPGENRGAKAHAWHLDVLNQTFRILPTRLNERDILGQLRPETYWQVRDILQQGAASAATLPLEQFHDNLAP